jgi:two-component system nitrate/nitrite response regulator NarL
VPSELDHIRIAVVSDDRLLSDALLQCLSEESDFFPAACPASPDGSLTQVTRDYGIALVDARSDALVAGGAVPEHPIVIFVGAPEDDAWATAALSAGARGILPRTSSRDDLVGAIRVVHGGGIWARRRWLNLCILQVVGTSKHRVATQDVVDTRLSPREREVLRHAATGVCNKELADRLSISEATVKVHLGRIFQKLGVSGRAELAAAYHDVARLDPMPPPVVRPPLHRIIPSAN